MAKKPIDWESRIGRRVRLRDLHVLSVVAQSGSMMKAAVQLSVTQPAVSKAIGDLEAALGVRLFDRGPQGAVLTIYGKEMLRCGSVIFDELRQGIRQLEFLANPTRGEIRIGCPESLAGMVSAIIDCLSRQHPQIIVHAIPALPALMQLDELRERNVDLLLGRVPQSLVEDDINVETLFSERLLVVVGAQNRWARRRKVALSELVNEQWILVPQGNLLSSLVTEAFSAQGLDLPRESVTSVSIHMTNHLLATGRFLTIMPSSALRQNAERWNLKALPTRLGVQPPPVGILSLKHRTPNPAAQYFIAHARTVAKSMSST